MSNLQAVIRKAELSSSFASQMIHQRIKKPYGSKLPTAFQFFDDRFQIYWLSYKEHRADAWALGAEEGRDKLRKAAGRSKYPLSRGCPNGETHLSRPQVPMRQSITHGREPGELEHLSTRRKRKKHRFPK